MITPAYRIAAAEAAISRHVNEVDPNSERPCCNADDASELLLSMALWAEVNGFCLRMPKRETVLEEITAP